MTDARVQPARVPAAWHADPTGRHQLRFWDGEKWTDWIADDGVQGTDPLMPEPQIADTSTGSTAQRTTRSGYLLLGADGHCNTEVAGEFARMDSIHRAVGRKPKLDEEVEQVDLLAALVPEPDNPYDPRAVMVQVNGGPLANFVSWHVSRWLWTSRICSCR